MPGRSLVDRAAEWFRLFTDRAEAAGVAPFADITTAGAAPPILFPLQSTGISTAPIKDAADPFLASLEDSGFH